MHIIYIDCLFLKWLVPVNSSVQYIQARLAKKTLRFLAMCFVIAQKMTPARKPDEGGSGNKNPAMGFGFFCFWRFGFWGVDGAQIAGTIYTLYICVYICAFPKKKSGKSKIFTGCSELIRISDTLSQSIGRGRISQVGPLVIRESRYRSDEVFAPHPKKRSLGLNSWSSKR